MRTRVQTGHPSAHMPSRSPYPYPPGGAQARQGRPRSALGRGRGRGYQPDLGPMLLAGGSLAALLLLPVLIFFGIYVYFQVSGRIVPGVYAGNTRIGGLTLSQAAFEIHKDWNVHRALTASNGLHSVQVAPATVGLSVDGLETAKNAYLVGHNQPALLEMTQLLYSMRKGWGVAPVVKLDPEAARAGLQALSASMSKQPQDATLRIENGKPVAVPGELGYAINMEDTLAAMSEDPRAIMLNASLAIKLRPVVPAVNDVSSALDEAERLLNTPTTIQVYDPVSDERLNWTVPPGKIAEWLVVFPGEQGPQIGLNSERLGEYLQELSAGLTGGRWIDAQRYSQPLAEALSQRAAYTVLLSHQPTTYIVQPGDTLIKIGWKVGMPYWRLLEANPGLNPDGLWTGQELIVPSKDIQLTYPVVPNKRIVISISQQRLWTYQDGALRSEHVISTGIDRSPTQPGIFQVQTHELSAYASVWDLTMPHFLGIYEAWPGFMNGIHGLPTLSNGRRLWANILGRPASYGCIILDLDAAEQLYNWAENGVVVEIQP